MKNIPRLGELELSVMEYVWKRRDDVTVPDVHEHLSRTRELAYTTVMTVMSRLYEKGLLERSNERRPHPYRYRPVITREDYSAGLMLGVLEEFGDRPAVLARFVERIGARDAEILQDLARKARKRRR